MPSGGEVMIGSRWLPNFLGVIFAEVTQTKGFPMKTVSKSKLIVSKLKEMGLDAPAGEVMTVLSKEGVEVSAMLVNNIKHRLRHPEKFLGKKGRKAEKVVAKRRKRVAVETVQSEFDKLIAFKKLANDLGGIESVKELLAKYEQIAA
jgi:hypothetical protein